MPKTPMRKIMRREESFMVKINSFLRLPRVRRSIGIMVALVFMTAMFAIVQGCAPRRARTVVVASSDGSVDVVYVQSAPPPLKVEVRPARPGRKAMWIPGYWRWQGKKYVWVAGYWDKKPRGKGWAAGHWDKRARGWVWVPGHWK